MPSNNTKDTKDIHGFALVGNDTIYACHIPMFYVENHCYQVILKVDLEKPMRDTYMISKLQNPSSTFFINNAPDDLITLPQIESGQKTQFGTQLYRGLPFDGGSLIYDKGITKISEVLVFHHFDKNKIKYPPNMEYYLFGTKNEQHLTHVIERAPNFQQIVDLEYPTENLLNTEIEIQKIAVPGLAINAKTIFSDPLIDKRYRVKNLATKSEVEIILGTKIWFKYLSEMAPNI